MWNKQRYCWQLQNHVWITNFPGENWKVTMLGKICISSWSYDMESHVKKCMERYCELTNKTTQQLFKVSTPCIDDHHFKEELKSVGELSKVSIQYLYLTRIGKLDILWTVNKLARSIAKWPKTCDKRLSRFDILHPSHMWVQTVLSCGKHLKSFVVWIIDNKISDDTNAERQARQHV